MIPNPRTQHMLAIAADATMLVPVPYVPAHLAKGLDRVRVTPVVPLVIVVVAVATFLALALIIGALAAYIYYCQTHGHKWPGFGVPTAHNGYYSLKCIK
jgi:hypothetical protein